MTSTCCRYIHGMRCRIVIAFHSSFANLAQILKLWAAFIYNVVMLDFRLAIVVWFSFFCTCTFTVHATSPWLAVICAWSSIQADNVCISCLSSPIACTGDQLQGTLRRHASMHSHTATTHPGCINSYLLKLQESEISVHVHIRTALCHLRFFKKKYQTTTEWKAEEQEREKRRVCVSEWRINSTWSAMMRYKTKLTQNAFGLFYLLLEGMSFLFEVLRLRACFF
jgi:hypothetical protein